MIGPIITEKMRKLIALAEKMPLRASGPMPNLEKCKVNSNVPSKCAKMYIPF